VAGATDCRRRTGGSRQERPDLRCYAETSKSTVVVSAILQTESIEEAAF
jgi:hypothetical protein